MVTVLKLEPLQTVCSHSLTVYSLSRRLGQVLASPHMSLLSLVLDFTLGWIVSVQVSSLVSERIVVTDTIFLGMEMVIRNLKSLIVWMMENPAGLKLNSVLSQALGNFFLYHIHLWMTYVMLVVPLLSPHLTSLLSLLTYSGLSVQLSLVSDLFLLLTIHIHCFYAYARRLAVSQWRGLVALWRLFLGKKYNPLRDRVDSADNSVEQLFVGTIIFTILLFLMPTTATFFLVFLSLKLAASSVTVVLRICVSAIMWMPETGVLVSQRNE